MPAIEQRRFPVLLRDERWRSSNWPRLYRLMTIDEFAAAAEMEVAETGEKKAKEGDTAVLLLQLNTVQSRIVIGALNCLARNDPQWIDAPDNVTAAVVYMLQSYAGILDEALRIRQQKEAEAARIAAEIVAEHEAEERNEQDDGPNAQA